MTIVEDFHASRDAASAAAAGRIAALLNEALAGEREAALVVSGGSTQRDPGSLKAAPEAQTA